MSAFRTALLRIPSPNFAEALSTADLGLPDYDLALAQHRAYQRTLEQCGLAPVFLAPTPELPDGTFVEDTAVCFDGGAVLTRPGAPGRREEIITMGKVLSGYFPALKRIVAPGTLDGGDVLRVNNHFYIGLSDRTNAEGARQLGAILQSSGKTTSTIPVTNLLHLKTGLSYIGHNTLIMTERFPDFADFSAFRIIRIPATETRAANCLWINEKLIMPAGYPITKKILEFQGYNIFEVDISEFEKADGGLTCLSLRF